jgi:type II secretory pathway pseudopilin PulG
MRRGRRLAGALVRRLGTQEGVVAILTAIIMVVLLASVAFAIDLARLRHDRQTLQAAVDLSALAGGDMMPIKTPADANAVLAEAQMVANANAPQLLSGGLVVTYKCIVSDPNGVGGQTSPDLGVACGPASGTWSSGWASKNGRSTHDCNPYVGDLCNTIVVSASNTLQYYFAPVIGIKTGTTGVVQGASCKGMCGQSSSPLDVVLVLDRTASMTAVNLADAKAGAMALLGVYDPTQQHVGLVALPYGDPNNKCNANGTQTYPNTNDSLWDVVPFSSDYNNPDGSINNNSALVKGINCLQLPPGNMKVTPPNSGHTDEGDPLKAAHDMLTTMGRPGVPQVIIFETDGQANQPNGYNPCSYAINQANLAKAAGITIVTLAYGVTGDRCDYENSGAWKGVWASTYLAAMATNSVDTDPGSCTPSENTDGDDYFCEATKGNLQTVFRRIAVVTIQHSRLIDI